MLGQSRAHQPATSDLPTTSASPCRVDSGTGFSADLDFDHSLYGWMFALFVICIMTMTHSAVQACLIVTAPVPPWLVQCLMWSGWFAYQSLVFPRLQRSVTHRNRSYRFAFVFSICPLISCTFALLAMPVTMAIWRLTSQTSFPAILAGAMIASLGIAVIVNAVRVIGVGSAFFKDEVVSTHSPLKHNGIYGRMRHPLFLGGVLVSLGSGLGLGDEVAVMCASVNIIIVPLYVRLEDRRLIRVFGDDYKAYAKSVPAMLL